MRITKVKVNKDTNDKTSMVLMHRKSDKGSLILDSANIINNPQTAPEDQTDIIIDELKNENFKLSLLKKTLEEPTEQNIHLCNSCKQKRKNKKKSKAELCESCKKRLNNAKSLYGKLEKLFKSLINEIIEKRPSNIRLLNASPDELAELQFCIKHKFREEFKYIKNEEEKKFCLKTDLSNYIEKRDFTELTHYIDWVKYYLQNKREFTKRSIVNNKIVIDYNKEATLSPRKACLKGWEEEYKRNGKLDLTALETTFGLAKLIPSLPIPSDKIDFSFNRSVKEALQARQKILFGKDSADHVVNRANKELSVYNNELIKYFEHYFPIKNKKKPLSCEQAKYYLKLNTIHDTVTHQIENAIQMQLLQEGKVTLHDFNENTNSTTLSATKRNEFFLLNLIESCAFATNNLRNIVDREQTQDILGKKELIESLDKDHFLNTLFNNEIYAYFFGEELPIQTADEVERLKQTIWAMRGSIQKIRNNIIHFKIDSLNTIFQIKGFEYPYGGKENLPYDQSLFKTYLEGDLKYAPSFFVEQLQSNDVLNFYKYEDVEKLLSRLTFSLCKCSIPFAPGFKTIYEIGKNMQKGRNQLFELTHYILKGKTAEETTRSKNYGAYRFLLKLIYNYCFLNDFLNNNNKAKFKATVEFIINKNREINIDKNKYKWAFKEIPYMGQGLSDESIEEYLSKIHSLTVQEENKKQDKEGEQRNNSQKFIEHLFAKGFDDFLTNLKVSFLLTAEQDLPKTETQPDYSSLGNYIKIQHNVSGNSNSHIAFYTFCKLLDAQHLSDLRNEFIKFDASSIKKEEKGQYQHIIDILGLCLLCVDSLKGRADKEENKRISDRVKTDWKEDLSAFVEKENGEFAAKECYMQQDAYTPVVHASIRLLRKYGTIDLLKQIIEKKTDNDTNFKVTKADYTEWQRFKVKADGKGCSQIEDYVNIRTQIHEKWAKLPSKQKKDFSKERKEEYRNACEKIERYNWLDNKIHLVHLKQLHNLMIEILSRLARFVALWDRDFVTFDRQLREHKYVFQNVVSLRDICTANITKKEYYINNWKNDIQRRKDNSGITLEDFEELQKDTKAKQSLYRNIFFKNNLNAFNDRNSIAHYNYLTKNAPISIIELINRLRDLMQYDRKLHNAVAKSIIKVFDKHGMELCLAFEDKDLDKNKHRLCLKEIKPKTIKHLENSDITTNLVSEEYCNFCRKMLEMKK